MDAQGLQKTASWLFSIAGVLLLVAIGVYLIGRVRGGAADSDDGTESLGGNFEQLHTEGELSDDEYRTIKSLLQQRTLERLNDKTEQG